MLDKFLRSDMPPSQKLMLACLVVFTITLFFAYSHATEGGLRGYSVGYIETGQWTVFTGYTDKHKEGTGWELAPWSLPVMLSLFVLYLRDPDELPLFRPLGWWLTPIVLFLSISCFGFETPALFVGLFAELGMLVAAGLHLFEQIKAKKADSPPGT